MIELRSGMIGSDRRCIVLLMTAVTIPSHPFEPAVRMTGRTLQRGVNADKAEIRLIVVKKRWLPAVHPVTQKTIVRKLCCEMIRSLCICEILLMTEETVIRQALEPVIHMARRTLEGSVSANQLKIRLGMLEDRRSPTVERMTRDTFVRQLPYLMIRCHRFGKIFCMAGVTI